MVIWEIVTDSTVLGFGVSSTQACVCLCVMEAPDGVWALGPVYSPAQVAHLRNLSCLNVSYNRWEKTLQSALQHPNLGLRGQTLPSAVQTGMLMCLLLFTNQNLFKANFSAYSAYTFRRKGST